jgi:hypothetical protein
MLASAVMAIFLAIAGRFHKASHRSAVEAQWESLRQVKFAAVSELRRFLGLKRDSRFFSLIGRDGITSEAGFAPP